MMSDTGSQSLFAVLRYGYRDPYLCSIVKLDKDIQSEKLPVPVPVRDGKWVAHFKVPPGKWVSHFRWLFSPPPTSSGDLYILPDWDWKSYKYDNAVAKLHGATFNCTTKGFKQIKPPHASKLGGVAVTVGLNIYFMTHPCFLGDPPFEDTLSAPVFERYSPADQLWEKLEPFPAAFARLSQQSYIVATAVWDDHTILLNVDRCQIWAYNVCSRKWYRVLVQDDKEAKHIGYGSKYQKNRCYAFKGEAFVVQNTIYALSDLRFNSVLALSIKKKQVPGGDLEYSCSIRSELSVPRAEDIQGIYGYWEHRSLTHMGEGNLCFLRSCTYEKPVVYQPIQVTYIKLTGEGKMDVTDDCIYRFEVPEEVLFEVVLCFSLPEECKTTASKQCGTFIFNPLTGCVSKQEDKTVLKPVQEEQGHPILLYNVPHDATARELEESLTNFGPMKRDIRFIKDDMGDCCFAYVEFERSISKIRAIEASQIEIRGCEVDITAYRSKRPPSVSSSFKVSGRSSSSSSSSSSGGSSSSCDRKRKR